MYSCVSVLPHKLKASEWWVCMYVCMCVVGTHVKWRREVIWNVISKKCCIVLWNEIFRNGFASTINAMHSNRTISYNALALFLLFHVLAIYSSLFFVHFSHKIPTSIVISTAFFFGHHGGISVVSLFLAKLSHFSLILHTRIYEKFYHPAV